jgi:hypothetical protein
VQHHQARLLAVMVEQLFLSRKLVTIINMYPGQLSLQLQNQPPKVQEQMVGLVTWPPLLLAKNIQL